MSELSSFAERIAGFVGFGKNGVKLEAPKVPFINHSPESTVEAIWAMGRVPLEVVRLKLVEQYPGKSGEMIDSMLGNVEAIRNGKKVNRDIGESTPEPGSLTQP